MEADTWKLTIDPLSSDSADQDATLVVKKFAANSLQSPANLAQSTVNVPKMSLNDVFHLSP